MHSVLRNVTMTYEEFRKWLRARRDSDGFVRAYIEDNIITGIPQDVTIFDELKVTVEKKILFWVFKKEVSLSMCCGYPMESSIITRCTFQAVDSTNEVASANQ